MENSKINSFIDKVSSGVCREIEELAVQLSLGKAEAAERFEEIKKDLKEKITDMQKSLDKAEDSIHAAAEKLKLQLSLGKAEASDKFEEQKDSILTALNEFEDKLKNNPALTELFREVSIESEKLKLKFELLKIKFQLKKIKIREEFKEEMKEFRDKVNDAFKSKNIKAGIMNNETFSEVNI